MLVHIEGMGVLGSVLAWSLYRESIPFTWSDPGLYAPERYPAAWPASTGLIYPGGTEDEQSAWQTWVDWSSDWHKAPWGGVLRACHKLSPFWYVSKNPPHGGTYACDCSVGPLRLATLPAVNVNPQALVERVRGGWDGQRDTTGLGQHATHKVIAHGFNQRLDHYLWGWHVKVKLGMDPRIWTPDQGWDSAPQIYLRDNAYRMSYANPIPGEEGWWYAGSSTIHQVKPKSLSIESKLVAWEQHLDNVTCNHVWVEEQGTSAEGWRPVAAKGDDKLVEEIDGTLVVRPMGGQGVRFAPAVAAAVIARLTR